MLFFEEGLGDKTDIKYLYGFIVATNSCSIVSAYFFQDRIQLGIYVPYDAIYSSNVHYFDKKARNK